jgi:phenylacetate-CoA ligase
MHTVAADIDIQLSWLMARRPHYLLTYSSVMRELALETHRRRLDLKFALLLSTATAVDNETRELCRSAFGAEIADTYGSTEVGHIAAQCRECGQYHISAETSVVEVLKADGSAAGPGEEGRVVVTNIYNYAMPLIRFEMGDIARVGQPRPSCRRGLPTLEGVLGRYRNMFRFRDGSRVWPDKSNYKLPHFIGLKQFQLVQTDFERIEVRYVPTEPERPVDLASLTKLMCTSLNQSVEIVLCPVESIPRSPSGKYEDCISLVGL